MTWNILLLLLYYFKINSRHILASHEEEEEEEVVEANTIDVSPTSRWICMKAMYIIFRSYIVVHNG
jgi:hypothetical protein